MSGAFETPDRQQENINVKNPGFGGELTQLPRYTSRYTLTIVFTTLLSCLTTALVVQTLSFMPLVLPHLYRLPWIALGVGLLVISIRLQLKQTIPLAAVLGTIAGTIVGL